MTIRAAVHEDARAIAAVHVASSSETYTGFLRDEVMGNLEEQRRAHWERVLDEDGRDVFVAVGHDGAVIGFVCGGPMPESIHGRPPIRGFDAYVDALYVLAAAHGHGAGRALLRALAQRLRERGLRSLALHVVAENPARQFYEHLGARFILAEPRWPGTDEPVQIAYGWDDVDRVPAGAPQ